MGMRDPRNEPQDFHGQARFPTGASVAMSAADVLRRVDSTMFMRGGDWLQESMATGGEPAIIDLRAERAYQQGHIKGSVHIPLQELPDRIESVASRAREVVCVCNGSVQSAMAVVFLRTLGYQRAFNLSGGMSAWERQGRPLAASDPSVRKAI